MDEFNRQIQEIRNSIAGLSATNQAGEVQKAILSKQIEALEKSVFSLAEMLQGPEGLLPAFAAYRNEIQNLKTEVDTIRARLNNGISEKIARFEERINNSIARQIEEIENKKREVVQHIRQAGGVDKEALMVELLGSIDSAVNAAAEKQGKGNLIGIIMGILGFLGAIAAILLT